MQIAKYKMFKNVIKQQMFNVIFLNSETIIIVWC